MLKLKTLLSKVVRYTLRYAIATTAGAGTGAAAAAAAAAANAAAAAAAAAALLGKAKPNYVYTTQFRVSLPLQSRSQAVVCVSTPRKYPRSGYFLVKYISKKFESQRNQRQIYK